MTECFRARFNAGGSEIGEQKRKGGQGCVLLLPVSRGSGFTQLTVAGRESTEAWGLWIRTTDGGWPGRGRRRGFAQRTAAAGDDGGVDDGFAQLTVAGRDEGGRPPIGVSWAWPRGRTRNESVCPE